MINSKWVVYITSVIEVLPVHSTFFLCYGSVKKFYFSWNPAYKKKLRKIPATRNRTS